MTDSGDIVLRYTQEAHFRMQQRDINGAAHCLMFSSMYLYLLTTENERVASNLFSDPLIADLLFRSDIHSEELDWLILHLNRADDGFSVFTETHYRDWRRHNFANCANALEAELATLNASGRSGGMHTEIVKLVIHGLRVLAARPLWVWASSSRLPKPPKPRYASRHMKWRIAPSASPLLDLKVATVLKVLSALAKETE
jgi:hypothetical protein